MPEQLPNWKKRLDRATVRSGKSSYQANVRHEKGAELYPFIIRENEHSNDVALQGFSPQEAQQAHDYLQRMRQNLEKDWDFVKAGGQRNY